MFRRVLLIVLDGVGVGALPDAAAYGDGEAATLPHVAAAVGGLALPHLTRMGLGNIAAIDGVPATGTPQAAWGKMGEQSAGKDSVTGHWELAGVILDQPFAVYPDGFPEQIIEAFEAATGLRPLGNVAASGTDILHRLGEEHLRSGRPIVYTSADSVFQIAAHEEVIPPQTLYRICRQVEKLLEPYRVCRVIARPFLGCNAEDFYRTAGRQDFPRSPAEPTLLDRLCEHNLATLGIGKIHDLYAGRGLRDWAVTQDNHEGMEKTLESLKSFSAGLIMTNLVDFDMLYGHRRDSHGFAAALADFDAWLPNCLAELRDHDLLLITADHGCDPTTPGTDHTREYVPLLAYAPRLAAIGELGVRSSFADVAATVAENFGFSIAHGTSFLHKLAG